MPTRAELVRSICEGCKSNRGKLDDTHQHCEVLGCRQCDNSVDLEKGVCPLAKWNSKYVGSELSNPSEIRKTKGCGRGKTLVIVANGPSKKDADLSLLHKHPEIDVAAINVPDQRLWPPKFWFISDFPQYQANARQFAIYNRTKLGTIFLSGANVRGPACVQLLGSDRFSLDPSKGVHVGGTTTNVVLQLARYWDYSRVFIFGLDMCRVGGNLYEWGDHKVFGKKYETRRERSFAREAETLWAACDAMGEFGNRIVVCSRHNRWPFMARLQRIDEREAVDHILNTKVDVTSVRKNGPKESMTLVQTHSKGWREAWRVAIDECPAGNDNCVLSSSKDGWESIGYKLAIAPDLKLSNLAIHGSIRGRLRKLLHDRVPERAIVERILGIAKRLG